MDCYFARVILIEHFENLLVLGPVQVELVLLLNFIIWVLLAVVICIGARFHIVVIILIFIGH